MKSGKFLFLAIIFLVSLVCISAVSAADEAVSDVIADTNDETVLQESIDDATLADSPNDEQILEESDDNVLSDGGDEWSEPAPNPPSIGTFSTLNDEINNGEDVVNLYSDYLYSDESDGDFKYGVEITRPVTIYGNGHKIDGKNLASIFRVHSSNVVFHDINFINGYSGGLGGAIWASDRFECTAINCNFTDNFAENNGGAIHEVSAINCTFTGNRAGDLGGAIWRGTATNSNFIGNYASGNGGAIYEGTAINCNFTQNRAENDGGALGFGTAINCNFNENSAYYGGALSNGDVSNCTFTQNIAYIAGGAISEGTATNCTFKDNQAETGGAISEGTATNCTFKDNQAYESGGAIYSGTASNCDFNGNHAENGGAFCFGIASNCDFNGNYAINGSAIYNGDATDCNFTENNGIQYAGSNGAIFISDGNEATVTNCYFNNNKADYAAAISGSVTANNCIFKDNSAYFECGAMYRGTAINCTFTGNSAKQNCGAIESATAINCSFTDNFAGCTYEGQGGGAFFRGTAINCTFTGNSATRNGGAMMDVNAINCSFIANSANEGGAMYRGNAENCTFALNTASVEGTDDTSETVTGDNCKFYKPVLSASDFSTAYNYGEKFIFKLVADDQVFDGIETILSISKNGATANYTALSGEGWTVNLEPGTYIVELSIPNSDVSSIFRTITVTKNPAKIAASAVTATYNVNKYLTIKLTDGKGKALSNVKVTVTLGTSKVYTTDKNGQIKINVATLVPKTYTATIKYAGNAYYVAASKSVKVAVKKATPKLTAKAKTFKVKVKTKKYTITLKNNKGKVMKKAKLTLKVGKKTYKATTNSKGKATFKITKLTKKGKYTAVIKYAGSKYYKALSKKVKITVKK